MRRAPALACLFAPAACYADVINPPPWVWFTLFGVPVIACVALLALVLYFPRTRRAAARPAKVGAVTYLLCFAALLTVRFDSGDLLAGLGYLGLLLTPWIVLVWIAAAVLYELLRKPPPTVAQQLEDSKRVA